MNKMEYLEALKEALKDTDQDVLNEILADYEEHFQVGLENGKTEEEICGELGAIEDLVEEIREVYGTGSNEKDNKKASKEKSKDSQDGTFHFKFDKFHFDNINGDTIGDLINSALNTAEEAISEIDVKALSKTVMSSLDQAVTVFNDFTDSCRNGMGFDTGSCSSKASEGMMENVTVSYGTEQNNTEMEAEAEEPAKENDTGDYQQKQQEHQSAVPSKLVVDGTVAEIIVKKSENGKLNLSYINNGNLRQKRIYEFYSCQEGDTVYAGVRKVGKSVFLMDFSEKALVITVELPDNMKMVQLKTVSGSIDVRNCTAEKLFMNSASGNMILSKIVATEIQVKTISGYLEFYDVESNGLEGKTTSGNISAKCVVSNTTSFESISGSLELNSVRAKVMNCQVLSGNIKLWNVQVTDGKVKSKSGDIVINDFGISNADISSISGELSVSNVEGNSLHANTTSGAIVMDVKVQKCYAGSKSGHIDIQAVGDIMLESNNISGNVNIHLRNDGNGYRINSKTTSGRLSVDYEQQHSSNLKSGIYTYGNQGSELTLDTVSGSMYLRDR